MSYNPYLDKLKEEYFKKAKLRAEYAGELESNTQDEQNSAWYGSMNPKENKREQDIYESNTENDESLGDALIKERSYSTDNEMVSSDNQTYIEQLNDGSFITQDKTRSKLNARDENNKLDFNKWKNPLYEKNWDSNTLDNNIFTQAYINSKSDKKEMIMEQISKEIKAKQELLNKETDPDVRDIISNDIDVLQATLFNPDATANFENYVNENFENSNLKEAITQSILWSKLNKPEEKNFVTDVLTKLTSGTYDTNSKNPFLYLVEYTGSDGKKKTKLGFANEGGVLERYKQQGLKDFKVIGTYQGADALELEQKMHYLLKKHGIKSNVDPLFGSGHTEVYDIDLLPEYGNKIGDTLKEGLAQSHASQMMLDYQKYNKGIVKYHDTLGYTWNLVKTGFAGVDSVISGAAAFILDNTVVNLSDRQNANSMLGQWSNMLHRRVEGNTYNYGIDQTTVQNASKSIHQSFADFSRGNIGAGVLNILKAFQAAPDLIVGSLAYVGTAAKISKAFKAIKGLGSSDFINTVLGLTMVEANNDINLAQKYNNGQNLSIEKKSAIFMGQFVNQLVQMGALHFVLKNGKFIGKTKEGEEIPLESIKKLDVPTYGKMVTRALLKPAGVISLGVLEEGPAEFIDTLAHELLSKQDTEQYKNMDTEALINKALPQAIEAGVFGAIMGSTMVTHRALGEILVPFSNTMHSMFYGEEYKALTLQKYIQSMPEDERYALADSLDFSLSQMEPAYTEQTNLLKSLRKGDINEVTDTLLKHLDLDNNAIHDNEQRSAYMQNFALEILSTVMGDIVKTPTFINNINAKAIFQEGTLTNLLQSIGVTNEISSAIEQNLNDILPGSKRREGLTNEEFINDIIGQINNRQDQTAYNKLLKIITETEQNTQDEATQNKLKRLNARLFSEIHKTNFKNDTKETFTTLKNNMSKRLTQNLIPEIEKSKQTIQVLKTAQDINHEVAKDIDVTKETYKNNLNKTINDITNTINKILPNINNTFPIKLIDNTSINKLIKNKLKEDNNFNYPIQIENEIINNIYDYINKNNNLDEITQKDLKDTLSKQLAGKIIDYINAIKDIKTYNKHLSTKLKGNVNKTTNIKENVEIKHKEKGLALLYISHILEGKYKDDEENDEENLAEDLEGLMNELFDSEHNIINKQALDHTVISLLRQELNNVDSLSEQEFTNIKNKLKLNIIKILKKRIENNNDIDDETKENYKDFIDALEESVNELIDKINLVEWLQKYKENNLEHTEKLTIEPENQYNKEQELNNLIKEFNSSIFKTLKASDIRNKLKEINTSTLDRILEMDDKKDKIHPRIRRIIAKELQQRTQGKAVLDIALNDAFNKSYTSKNIKEQNTEKLIAALSFISGSTYIDDDMYEWALNTIEELKERNYNEKELTFIENEINNKYDKQLKDDTIKEAENNKSDLHQRIAIFNKFDKLIENNDQIDLNNIQQLINSLNINTLEELNNIIADDTNIDLVEFREILNNFFNEYFTDNENSDIMTNEYQQLLKKEIFNYVKHYDPNREINEQDQETIKIICSS